MEIAEPIDEINLRLKRNYGLYDDKPNFRVVWSEDQFEKRKVTHTPEGLQLMYPKVMEVPKYRNYIQERFILERLVPVDENNTDLTEKISYEPCWTFNHAETGEYIPPRYDMCQVIIESLFMATGNKFAHAKYKDPDVDPAYRMLELDKMQKKLFGNETPVGDALAHGYGVTNPAGKEHFKEVKDNGS